MIDQHGLVVFSRWSCWCSKTKQPRFKRAYFWSLVQPTLSTEPSGVLLVSSATSSTCWFWWVALAQLQRPPLKATPPVCQNMNFWRQTEWLMRMCTFLTWLQVLMSTPFFKNSRTLSMFPALAARRKLVLLSDWSEENTLKCLLESVEYPCFRAQWLLRSLHYKSWFKNGKNYY